MTRSDPPRRERPRGARGLLTRCALTALAAALALTGTSCTAPALTEDAYLDDARQTAGDLLSAVRTGTLVSELAEDDRAFRPYLEVSAKDAEDSARSLTDTFGSLQPPSPSCDSLRDEVTDLSDAAVHGLSALRVALKREDPDGVAGAAEALHETAAALVELQEELR
ncbi:hypothetical protein [Nocardiopsis alborubida]|uniref:Uncharacterized protein n=1 Tax=Nocardiopsis alborubida TaxID=146802 RepID=A0A7X6RP40_9ACTN|nr:hypothetical protein [Nocardiopsis alborubida]NKY97344.1 hypothetical protein [Nocardiopsis alborubida]